MKAIDFIKVLRKVIREEVKQVVREELKAVKPLISERHTVVPAKKVVKPDSVKQEPARRNYPLVTIDGALGDILNETANSMYNSHQEEQDEWPDMNGGPMTSDHLGDMDITNGFSAPQQRMNMSADPSSMFMKDYSKVLKAAEEKSQTYRG